MEMISRFGCNDYENDWQTHLIIVQYTEFFHVLHCQQFYWSVIWRNKSPAAAFVEQSNIKSEVLSEYSNIAIAQGAESSLVVLKRRIFLFRQNNFNG